MTLDDALFLWQIYAPVVLAFAGFLLTLACWHLRRELRQLRTDVEDERTRCRLTVEDSFGTPIGQCARRDPHRPIRDCRLPTWNDETPEERKKPKR